jgi:hypothetical protein
MASLVFILTFLFVLYSIVASTYFLLKKNELAFKKTSMRLLIAVIIYGTILLIFSLLSKSTALPLNKDKCFDDWCTAIVKIEKVRSGDDVDYLVTLKISNHGRGRAQKPDSPHIYVIDEQSKVYLESNLAKAHYEKKLGVQPDFAGIVQPQSSFETIMFFRLPADKIASLVITEGGFPTPLIIGDEGSLFHKKSSTLLE